MVRRRQTGGSCREYRRRWCWLEIGTLQVGEREVLHSTPGMELSELSYGCEWTDGQGKADKGAS